MIYKYEYVQKEKLNREKSVKAELFISIRFFDNFFRYSISIFQQIFSPKHISTTVEFSII